MTEELQYESGAIKFRYKPGDIIKHLHDVMSEIEPIKKDRSGTNISYKFRGIDQVYAELQPLLIKHKIIVLPTSTNSVRYDERESKNGGALNYCRLVQEYTFFSATDDSYVGAELPGEAMDSSDKSTTKALSAAFKYLAFQGFCIPVENPEDSDADATSHELKPRSQYTPSTSAPQTGPKLGDGPPCPDCGKALFRSRQQEGQLFCWKKEKGCGYDSLRAGG